MKAAHNFLLFGLVALLIGMSFGCIGGLQYVIPEFLAKSFSFNKVRPIHVSLVISWIFMAASGGIYFYLPRIISYTSKSKLLPRLHLILFTGTIILILFCYSFGIFGGKEYWEFPPVLSVPLAISWIFFIIYFFRYVAKASRPWPVYLWMWSTGVSFFLFTFIEQYLWLIPYFRDNIIRDITVQWKSMGAIVGSWNMLVYGTAFYLMEQISGDKKSAHSRTVFFFYFLGLTNLLFNWGHHTYIVPAKPWIKDVSYLISMTELLILGRIIIDWRKSVSAARKHSHIFSYRLLMASDVWIFLNLVLAILMSIPVINRYTHGTHITVAHAMGTTVGINTMILLASVFYIAFGNEQSFTEKRKKYLNAGFLITNVALGVFWFSLIGAGITKAMQSDFNSTSTFYSVMGKMAIFFQLFSISGFFLLAGISMLAIPLIKKLRN